jgi:hypothetical protein
MSRLDMILNLEKKHFDVQNLVHSYASRHRIVDMVIGGASNLIPMPGAAFLATAALVSAQTPLVYQPLSKEVASIYSKSMSSTESSFSDESNADENHEYNKIYDIQFLVEIAQELVSEVTTGSIVAAIPFIGFAAAAAMDAMIAATMTWRVGLMTSIYHCNFGEWLGSRRETFEIAKKHVGPLSARSKNRIQIQEIISKNDEILEKQRKCLQLNFIDPLRKLGRSDHEIRDQAINLCIPSYLFEKQTSENYQQTWDW